MNENSEIESQLQPKIQLSGIQVGIRELKVEGQRERVFIFDWLRVNIKQDFNDPNCHQLEKTSVPSLIVFCSVHTS